MTMMMMTVEMMMIRGPKLQGEIYDDFDLKGSLAICIMIIMMIVVVVVVVVI